MTQHNTGPYIEPKERLGTTEVPEVVLVSPETHVEEPREWDGLARAIVEGDPRLSGAPFAVLGGAGTGKSSLLLDTLVNFLANGGEADQVMFIAPSKEAASVLNKQLLDRLAEFEDFAALRSPIKAVHSWAFSAFRSLLLNQEEPAPRLLTGAEHDADIRLLLAGDAEDGKGSWPDNVRAALPFVGFARQLRDLLLRAEERGVGPKELKKLGQRYNRGMWVGAGDFMGQFRHSRKLAQSVDVNVSELMHRTLEELDKDSAAGENSKVQQWQRNIRLVLVDDAHNLDPAAAQFIERFFSADTRVVIAGDPDQCVFHFRGADEAFLERYSADEDRRVVLSQSRRFGGVRSAAINELTSLLPPLQTRIPLREAELGEPNAGEPIKVLRAKSSTAERLHIANELRRAHVVDGVSWDDMAVIVRSTSAIPPIRRALLTHGVPVQVDQTSLVLSEQPIVRLLLMAMDATHRPLTSAEARLLMESMVGGADPIMVRRLERAVSVALAQQRQRGAQPRYRDDGLPFQALDCLTALINDDAEETEREEWTASFNARETEILAKVIGVVSAGKQAKRAKGSIEDVLWEIWQATGLASTLQNHSLRGGTLGSQADQDLDAAMMLFDFAGDFVERRPNASIRTFTDEVRSQELPTGVRDRGTRVNAVEILPAHAAAGRQWDMAIVAGVQEDLWPTGPTVGGLFGQLELVDYLDRGIEPGTRVSRVAAAVHEERRLFLLALSRASREVIVTAVDNISVEGGVPSRFIEEIEAAPQVTCELVPAGSIGDAAHETNAGAQGTEAQGADDVDPEATRATDLALVSGLPRVLAIEPLIAELRDAVTDPSRRYSVRQSAARNLAAMASADIFGAHPNSWWGIAEPSVMERVTDSKNRVFVSPSKVDSVEGCALRSFLDNHRGAQAQTNQMRVGIIIHAIAQAIVEHGLSLEEAQSAGKKALTHALDAAEFEVRSQLDRWEEGIRNLHDWLTQTISQAEGGQWEAEKKIEVPLGSLESGEPVILRGRIDLMHIQDDDRVVVYDFKTGKTAKSKDDAENSPQLASYQFMIEKGLGKTAYGAHLVYPSTGTKSTKVASQSDPTAEQQEARGAMLLQIGDQLSAPIQLATVEERTCQMCDYQSMCPARPQGRQVVS